jgi:6-phosphogluconate dehydrogenase
MELGFVGLGRMGGNMVTRLAQAGHRIVAYDRSPDAVASVQAHGARGVASLGELVKALSPPRAVWVMVPAGEPTEMTIRALADVLSPGDAIVDGGNSYYKDDVRRGRELASRGLSYVDAGTSGGIWGLANGYCLMVGGEDAVVDRLPRFSSAWPRRTAGCAWDRAGAGTT